MPIYGFQVLFIMNSTSAMYNNKITITSVLNNNKIRMHMDSKKKKNIEIKYI